MEECVKRIVFSWDQAYNTLQTMLVFEDVVETAL